MGTLTNSEDTDELPLTCYMPGGGGGWGGLGGGGGGTLIFSSYIAKKISVISSIQTIFEILATPKNIPHSEP